MSVFYGSDTSCVSDIPLIDLQVTKPSILVGQRIARRLTTPRGALASINDDPDFGWDCRQYVNAKLAPSDIITAKAQISAEVLKDEQVESCTVEFVGPNSAGALTITVNGTLSNGPFSLTLNVGQLTTDLVLG